VADWMKCLEKEVRLVHRRGRRSHVSVIREHYLRDDISCKAEKCRICQHQLREKQSLGSKGG
jgi:DIS3-like exonuclease 1